EHRPRPQPPPAAAEARPHRRRAAGPAGARRAPPPAARRGPARGRRPGAGAPRAPAEGPLLRGAGSPARRPVALGRRGAGATGGGARSGGVAVNRRTDIALRSVAAERERQDQKKAEGRFRFTCADDGLTLTDKVAILGEEFGEVCKEALTNDRRRLAR